MMRINSPQITSSLFITALLPSFLCGTDVFFLQLFQQLNISEASGKIPYITRIKQFYSGLVSVNRPVMLYYISNHLFIFNLGDDV